MLTLERFFSSVNRRDIYAFCHHLMLFSYLFENCCILLSRRTYHTSITPASHMSALVFHSHHKMLLVARCAKMTRVERGVKRCGHLDEFAQTRKLRGFPKSNRCYGRERGDRANTRF
jgi:hypothetical protein